MLLKVEYVEKAGFKALMAACDIKAGTKLIDLSGDTEILRESAWNTIHITEKEHLVITTKLLYTNHCCRTPNAEFEFNTQPWLLVATRDIRKNEWVTYDYATTEYVSGRAFDCQCSSGKCRGSFNGFSALSDDEKRDMIEKKKISPVVLALHLKEKA
uniref:Uncharacterized protein n=1 Tax=Clytia hemisphaerica TaxID=252671 RepID=A0A7M5VFP7_9CNID|eukprot:TCONS_00066280-protein